jgi:hypothetical protein
MSNIRVISPQNLAINGINIPNRIDAKTLRNGEVLKCGIDDEPLLFHYAIVIGNGDDLLIAHNPFVKDVISLDTVDNFFDNRYIIINHGVLTNKTKEQLLAKFNEIKDKKYSLLSYNCEDFVNEMIDKPNFFYRGKYLFFGSLILLGYLTYKYIKSKK